jgi:eukaryotic-like serine/threonine-protein kinase
MELEPGDVIPGPIRLEAVIYARDAGVIWRGHHEGRDEPVSVKIPSARALVDDEELAERFHLESRATKEIHSPHVVRVLAEGVTSQNVPFVVMEALDGEPLRARLERDAKLTLQDVDDLVAQTGAALSAAHAVGIVHRDINPETIFLNRSHGSRTSVKLVDFGVAKVIGGRLADPGLTRHGRLLGTPAYLSPERASAKRPTPHADMWSLAVVTYEAIIGRTPFEARALGMQLVKIIEGDYEPVSKLREELGDDIDAWFARAFAQQLTMRFKTVHDMVAAFSLAIAGTDDALDWSL